MRRLGGSEVADAASVPHHGDAIGQIEHLFHAMRDVDDGDPVVAQLADDLKKLLGFAGRQR